MTETGRMFHPPPCSPHHLGQQNSMRVKSLSVSSPPSEEAVSRTLNLPPNTGVHFLHSAGRLVWASSNVPGPFEHHP